ncbi:hypothetical protein PHYBLDRAFT_153648 [Phycomyces blakesleeanus NRRL 1555(-)]|uniref:Uncharacterized protein n=1 Tax=Phycomyces blakesleeanus (strain ATCC 8743b / DSM 1359 / FGSC 10004 / NBRC 33097 / NRRL 1555) TaxID=763407 RepID=A0A162Z9P4_PHYB8|nr:hypothetical protein PHYBLDRAFT_153648 [Phycomyces blakesleeanus NRRL 1555(-)]OAD65261.1 hypothetical protein PHYBLDRAFT_153648 [Phycomyces blakesleeanus NRRL 1555(-)]|eukprot:XP_018283301.1 hypothetical protein PHYBLDRAFT_153648 [Phycomyces blakesleeanus NRRL 1555(-)]
MARRPTRKAKACARRKGQTAPQERPKYVPEEKGKPPHKKGQSMCQKKRANRPTRKATVCASKKGQLAHKKDHSMCQQKWLTILQERPKYAPEQTSMRPTRKANAPNAHQRKKGFSETLKVTYNLQNSQAKVHCYVQVQVQIQFQVLSKSKTKCPKTVQVLF